jgi:hypothetical protein
LSTVEISSVWFPIEAFPDDHEEARRSTSAFPHLEKVRLQLGSRNAEAKAPGLIINDRSVTKYLIHGEGTLDVSKMIDAFGTQCATGGCSMPPRFSFDGIMEPLKGRGFRSIKMSATKVSAKK